MNRSKGFGIAAAAIAGVLALASGGWTIDALAAATQLSNVPVAGTGQAVPKPNVMLLMDTSRSMAFSHMPDELEFPAGPTTVSYEMPIGYRSAQCNALYYDPAKVYEMPRGADGYYLINPPTGINFRASRYDFYSTNAATVDLAAGFQAYDRNTRQVQIANVAEDKAQPAYYYTYEGTSALAYNTAPCTDMESAKFAGVDLTQSNVTAPATNGGVWRRKLVTGSSGTGAAGADERNNFAIWYTFYRTRMAMVKSSISLAFNPINDGFRVGLISMNPLVSNGSSANASSGVDPAKYLAINDFGDAQKTAWYNKLYGQTPDGSSPAREGLARVGRHYAGRADGINTNMTPDPVQYSCQQNFTIMTTDGYWNTAAETNGPVMIDGTTHVGNTDGSLTPKTILDRFDPKLYSHRPIWDGTTSGSRTDTTTSSMNRYQTCDPGEYFRTTSVVFRATSQPTQRTQSLTRTTQQISASTVQTDRSTTQDRKTTSTQTRESLQNLASTKQQTLSTRQELVTHTWWGQGTRKVYRSTTQNLQTSSYTLQSQTQTQTRTRTQTMTQTRQWYTQQKTTLATSQILQTKSQTQQTVTRTQSYTTQLVQRTTQPRQQTTQYLQSTSQTLAYNGATETTTPVQSCSPGGNTSCLSLKTGPTPVASCTPQSPSAGNNWVTTTCATQQSAITPVQSCTNQAATSGNNFVATDCSNSKDSGNVPVASCTPVTGSASNSWTTVGCNTATSALTPVTSCTESTGANYVQTHCDNTTTPPVKTFVQSCTSGTDNTTKAVTTCDPVVSGPTPVASCAASGPTSANSWTTTTCPTPITTSTPVASKASCNATSASSGNSYTTTTCTTVQTLSRTPTASCTNAGGSSPNYYETVCETPVETVTPVTKVASCTAVTPTSGNNFIRTTCGGASYTAWTSAATCTAQSPDSTNNFLERQCQQSSPPVTAQVRPTECTPGTSNTGLVTTCTATLQKDVPVSSCVANPGGPTIVTCSTANTGPTLVASCTPGGDATTNWVITSCSTVDTPETNVGTCTPVSAGAGNGNTATFCNQHTETVPTPPGSCVAQSANAGNNWVTTTCPAPVTSGPTGVVFGSCTPVAASLANAWTATTCATNGPTTPTGVASCTAGTSANFTITTCTTNNTPVTNVTPGSCTPQSPTSANGYTTVNCVSSAPVVGVAAGTCVPESPTSANGFKAITCDTVTTGPTFVAQGTCTPGTSGNFTKTTCNTVNTGPTLVAACTNGTDNNFKVTSCTVNTSPVQQLTPGTACTSAEPTSGNNYTRTTCTPSDTTVGVAPNTCVPSPRGVLPVVTCDTAVTPATAVASCTPGTDGNFLTTTCTSNTVGPDRVTSCSAVNPTSANGYSSTTCVPIPGLKVQTRTQTVVATYDVSGDTAITASTRDSTTTVSDWADQPGGICYASPATPPVVDVSGNWGPATTVKGDVKGTGLQGSIDSLADVAQYYYVTDLRPGMSDDIPRLGEGIEDDRAPWQHMTTFVVGLGVSGTLNYQENYKSATTGDFSKIRSYENTPQFNWPVWPTSSNLSSLEYNDPRSIDDFWHTAVNGRGKYFSARDPQTVVDGLKEALSGIKAQAGAGAGASTSSLTPTAGDNTAYTASFTTLDWTGEVQAQVLDTTTGNLSTTVNWSARALLDAKVSDACDNRKIYARDPSNGALVNFTWNTKACDSTGAPTGSASTGLTAGMQALFTGSTITGGLSQYPFMTDGTYSTLDQRTAAVGANLVNYLRGQRSREGFVANTTKLYRARAHVLGDIVNSQPAYVKAPGQFYQDAGYDTFKTTNKSRTPMVYVGANDGMLHAFYAPVNSSDANYANAGQEAWAYVPQVPMAKMWNLADMNYADKHQFFVDSSPIAGDVKVGGVWKSMIVGGLGGGGNGYYALDVTDPAAPKAMWEFNLSAACASNPIGATGDCNLGLTFGRPIITKLRNGTWVVLVTSGYNNIDKGDGRGYLYVLDAGTGAIIQRIATSAGTTGTPSGLREINTFVNNFTYDNTSERVYGADLLGNIWRFDINDVIAPTGYESYLLATAQDKNGNPQPITTRPVLVEVNGVTMAVVGTGRMLSTDDLTSTSAQTVYGFQDPLTSTSAPLYSDMRSQLNPLQLVQSGSGTTATRTTQCASTDVGACTKTTGWYIDLPDSGERVNVDMQSVLGTLVFASNVPSNTMCAGGGYSWLNYVDILTGLPVSSSDSGTTSVPYFSNSVVVGLGIVGLPDGTFRAIGRDATGATRSLPIPVGSPPPQGKRISWRELVR